MQFTHNLNIWQPWECAGTNSCFTYPAPHYNGLIEYNPETDDLVDIRGDLAKGWELGDDGVTYIFPLHENVRWHDGMPLTAKDVVFSLDSMTDPDESRPVVGKLGIFYESSRAIDEYTVEVKTKFPAPAFMPSLATEYHKMMAKHWLETGVDMKLRENVMGSGPYKPGKAELNVLVEYLRNEDYFKEGRPYFDSMTYFIISDQGTTNAAFRAGQVLFHANPSSGLSNKESLALAEDMKGRARVIFDGPVAPLWVQFNTNREPFTDPRVRHALHLVAHRQPFIQTFSPGIDRLGGPFPPGFWFGISEEDLEKLPGYRQTPDGKKHPDDIAEAKRLLKEAGVPDNFKAKVASPNFVEFPQMASIMADQLRTFLGWDAASDTTQTATWVEQRNSGQFQLSVGGYGLPRIHRRRASG